MIEKFLNNLLSQLGAGSKENVYVSVTPGLGVEMLQIAPALKAVKKYAYRPLEYSDVTREIADYESFKTALQELFEELEISPKSNVFLSLPMVLWGKIELPLILKDDGITEAIVSEVEQAYIFKRCEPVVSWFDSFAASSSESRTIFYSAIQKTALDKIKEVLSSMGTTLSRVEVSTLSTFRALSYSGLTDVQMAEGTSWNLMIVNPNGYSVVAMLGKNIIDYYEEPLALKTCDSEEVYNVIKNSAQLSLMNFPTNYLYIISETDMVSAEILSSRLQVDGKVDFLENNKYRKKEVLPTSLDILPDNVLKISLEAVGIASLSLIDYPINFAFGDTNVADNAEVDETVSFDWGGKEIILTGSVQKKIALAIGALFLIPALAAFLLLPQVKNTHQAKLDEVNSQIKKLDESIKKYTEEDYSSGFNVENEIENILKMNRAKLMAYSALGESVPRNLWITYFITKDAGKIDIKGVAEEVEDIYIFFRNLKDNLVDTQLRLYKLEMQANSVDDAVLSTGSSLYEFQITNISDAEMNNGTESGDAASGDDKKSDKSDKKSDSKKKVDDLEPVEVN